MLVYSVVSVCRLFLLVLWLGICEEVDVDGITLYPPPPFFLSLPTILSLIQVSELFETGAPLKLVSVPFSSLLLDIGHLEKSFPQSII